MIRTLVDFALNNRFVVLSMAILLFIWGMISFHNLPVEAYPDVANTWVQVITQWPWASRGRSGAAGHHSHRDPDERHSAPSACALGVAGRIVCCESDLRRQLRQRLGPTENPGTTFAGYASARSLGRNWSGLQPNRLRVLVHAEEHESWLRFNGPEVAAGLGDRLVMPVHHHESLLRCGIRTRRLRPGFSGAFFDGIARIAVKAALLQTHYVIIQRIFQFQYGTIRPAELPGEVSPVVAQKVIHRQGRASRAVERLDLSPFQPSHF